MEKEEVLYTKLDNYSEVFGLFTMFKNKMRNLKLIMSNVEDIQEKEEEILSKWESIIKDVSEKIDFIDNKMKPE